MEREHDTAELIELGQASVETKGVQGLFLDEVANLIETSGLSDD